MTTRPSPDPPDMDAMIELARRIEIARQTEPALETLECGELLRFVPGKRAVIEGAYGGRPAVIRLFLENEKAVSRAFWQELQRAWPQMKSGEFRVCEPLCHAPEHGIVVVEMVPGTPLFQNLWQSAPGQRDWIWKPVAEWLRRYSAGTEVAARASPRNWIEKAGRASRTQPFKELYEVEAAILTQMHRLASLIEGSKWRFAIGHGDFHPNNLIVDGRRLTGIDIGGSARAPVYRDMARFLMHMGRRGMVPSGDRFLGVDRAGITAFSDAFDLSAEERGIALPFMIAADALIRVETPGLSASRIRRANEAYQALLTDLQGIR